MLPGDTKLSTKRWSWMGPKAKTSSDEFREWVEVVGQVVSYSAACGVRYGFIATDYEVMFLRITRLELGPGIAAGRPPRSTHRRPPSSDVSMKSGSLNNPSSSSNRPSTSSYRDTNPVNWDYYVEFKAIPWSAQGDCLTAKLALFALPLLPGNGIDDDVVDLGAGKGKDIGQSMSSVSQGTYTPGHHTGSAIEEEGEWAGEGDGEAEAEEGGEEYGDDNEEPGSDGDEEEEPPQFSRMGSTAGGDEPSASASSSGLAQKVTIRTTLKSKGKERYPTRTTGASRKPPTGKTG